MSSTNLNFFPLKLGVSSLLTLGSIFLTNLALPTLAAEKIFFVYSPIKASLRVQSLEKFAENGTVNQDLQKYFGLVKPSEEEKELFQKALTTPVQVDFTLLSRLLNTEEAERIFNYFGKVINIEGGANGRYILRGAIIQAAMEPEGLTLINVLKKLPTNVQINLREALEYSKQVELVVDGSYLFNDQVTKLSQQEASQADKIDFAQLPDIRNTGQLEVETNTWNLTDSSRTRKMYVNVYQPAQMTRDKTPVVIISHGLSSSPESFESGAKYLASYGFVVIIPQHPGSDEKHTQDLIEGYTRQVFFLNEFIDRPQDISYVLDELERRNEAEFEGKLDLENVGIAGHSFGGYTALAVAGATIDFERLERNCDLDIGNLNTALLLQCRALKLERQEYDFRDERIKAVFAYNPVNASIFGETGLNKVTIPTYIGAGSYDPATPFIFEQARSYPFLGSEKTYLQLQEGQAHVDFAELDAGITNMLTQVTGLTLPAPMLLEKYTQPFLLAFFQVYINEDDSYSSYLDSSYADYLSEGEEFKNHLITKASADKFSAIVEQFIKENYDTIFEKTSRVNGVSDLTLVQ
jgi:predicted dienelactone hydrolase